MIERLKELRAQRDAINKEIAEIEATLRALIGEPFRTGSVTDLVLEFMQSQNGENVTAREIAMSVHRGGTNQALATLVARGLIDRVAHGVYRLKP